MNRVDIVNVIGDYVPLKKAGANFLGLCPFHSEKSPSFTVSPTKQFYHCFGCGKNGTAISFLMEYSGLSFVEAVETIARSTGMVVPDDKIAFSPAKSAENQAKSLALSDVMTQAYQFYRKQLKTSQPAISYLKNRGLSGEIAAQFGLGYAPDSREGLRNEFVDYATKELVDTGLVIERSEEEAQGSRRYDRFRDRIMFPIRNTKGQVIGFGGRIIEKGEPKYLNSPETPLFQKGNELYGLFEARQAIRSAGYVLVVEGYMDVVALAQHGYPQTVATLGTACTPVQVQKLMRQTDTVIFAFDGDSAGKKAARRALEASLPYITDNKSVRFLFLPAEHDPDSFIREFGSEGFEKGIQETVPLSEFLFQEIIQGNDLNTMEGRARAQYTAKPFFQALSPSALRSQMVRRLGQLTQTADEEVESFLGFKKTNTAFSRRVKERGVRKPIVGQERKVMRWLLAFPELAVELDEAEVAAIQSFAPNNAEILAKIYNAIHEFGESVSFASLLEYLRSSGTEYEELIAEVAEGHDVDIAFARLELKQAVWRIRMTIIANELEALFSSSLSVEEKKQRYQELTTQQENLRKLFTEAETKNR